MVLDFPILNSGVLDIKGKSFYLTHGHIYNPENPLNINSNYVLYGHTHIKGIKKVNDTLYINPGSISIPKDNVNSFIIIDESISIYDFNMNLIEELKF
jgi:predicted phosphodiesterase